jgi:polar amino acid transport system substrate-binding protein
MRNSVRVLRRLAKNLSIAVSLGATLLCGEVGAATAQPVAPSSSLVLPPRSAPDQAPPVLRVATGVVAPFVMEQDGVLIGFSIDLWSAIAKRLGVQTMLVNTGPRDTPAQIAAVVNGEADVAISAIPVTAAREEVVDFCLPFFDGGLHILALAEGEPDILTTLRDAASPALAHTLLAGLGIGLLLAHLLWLVERHHNPRAPRGYLAGVGDALWGVMQIIATGEHGDRETPSVVKRLTIASMWLFGVVLIAQFTATVTSSLTVQQLRSEIRGLEDLVGRRIASVAGSVAADYLKARGLTFVPITSPEQAIAGLLQGQIDAIVYEAPTLQYWANRLGGGRVQLAGPLFHPEKYAAAVPMGSPLRKRINAALLEVMDNGTYDELRRRWFPR